MGRNRKTNTPKNGKGAKAKKKAPEIDDVEPEDELEHGTGDLPREDGLQTPELDDNESLRAHNDGGEGGGQPAAGPVALAIANLPPARRTTRSQTKQQQNTLVQPGQQDMVDICMQPAAATRRGNRVIAQEATVGKNAGLEVLAEAAEIVQTAGGREGSQEVNYDQSDPWADQGARSPSEQSLEAENDKLPHGSTLRESMDPEISDEQPVEEAPAKRRGPGHPKKVPEAPPSPEPVIIDFFIKIKAVQHRVKLLSDTEWSDAEDKLLEKLKMRQKTEPQLAFKLSDAPQREDPRIFDSSEYGELVHELERHGLSMKRDARIKPKSVVIFVRKELEAAKDSKSKGGTSTSRKRKQAQSPPNTDSSGSESESGSDGSDTSGASRRKRKCVEKKGRLTISKALEKIEEAQLCALHGRSCKVGPDGEHTPFTVEEKQYWAVLLHKGEASEQYPPPGIVNGNFVRVHHQKAKTLKQETTPQPIQIQIAPPPVPSFPSQYLLQAPNFTGASSSRAPSPNYHILSSDGLEEDATLFPTIQSFLTELDHTALAATSNGEDYRNLSQFIDVLVVQNGYVRIHEIYDRYREEKDGRFLKTKLEFPVSTADGTADFLWNQIRKKVKAIRKSSKV
ncbi:hypothetical protein FRC04_003504 [Tulasnella sp. 424]|nr:hypothetical protein FRC04_003504 [Tulasnella sp. 424]